MDICVPPLTCRLPSSAEAANHSWFTAAHVALLVSIAALAVSIVFGVVGLLLTRRSARASEDSAKSSKVSAKAAEDSARAAKGMLDIERDREYDRMRPKLWGRLVPEHGGPTPINAWLEVHLDASTPQPLRSMLLTLPSGNGFGRGPGAVGLANDFGFPGEPGQAPPIRPGWPARWRVYRGDNARGTLMATAKCTREDGKVWWDVEVPVSQDLEENQT